MHSMSEVNIEVKGLGHFQSISQILVSVRWREASAASVSVRPDGLVTRGR